MQHTLGHVDCQACAQKGFITKAEIPKEMLYPEASAKWIESREFKAGKDGRSHYLRRHSLRDLRDYDRPLKRFFGKLALCKILLGHLRQYQEERAAGLLGPGPDELFAMYLARVAKSLDKTEAEVLADPQMHALVTAQVEAHDRREVGPNKINQELAMLIRLMKVAGVWTTEMDEGYETLEHEESDIPRALSPDEQEIFLRVAQGSPFIHKYSIVGIDCTLRTMEERELKLGDINLRQGIILVRAKSAKNKYSIRTIPLSDQAHWAMEGLIERAKSLGSCQPQHYLMPFHVARGVYDPTRPMTVSGIKKPWEAVRREAGVPWFTPYNLRHTGCTRLAEAGTPIHIILAFAGHMSRRTQDHYVQISEQAKRRTAQRSYSLPAAIIVANGTAKGKPAQSLTRADGARKIGNGEGYQDGQD